MIATADDARKMGDAVSKAGDKMDSAAAATVKSWENVGKTLAATISVATVAAGAMDALNRMQEIREQKASAALGKTQTLDAALAAAGQSNAAPDVRLSLNAMINPEEATNRFAAVSRAAGNRISAEEKLKAVEAGNLARAAHMDEAGATEMATNFAQLARQRGKDGGFENYTDEQLAELAHEVTVNAPGGLSDRDLRFISRAGNKKEALQILFASRQSDESARGLSAIQQNAERDFNAVEIRKLHKERRTNPEAERLLRLSEIPKDQRISAILADPSLAEPAERLAVENLKRGLGHVPQVQSIREAADITGDMFTKLADRDKEAAAQEQRNIASGGAGALRRESLDRLLKAKFEREHPFMAHYLPFTSSLVTDFQRLTDKPNNQLVPLHRTDEDFRDPHLKALNTLIGLTKDQTESVDQAMQEQISLQRTSRNAVLSNNSEGQK